MKSKTKKSMGKNNVCSICGDKLDKMGMCPKCDKVKGKVKYKGGK